MNNTVKRFFIRTAPVLFFVLVFYLVLSGEILAQSDPNPIHEEVIPKPQVSFIFHFADKIVDGWLAFLDALGKTFEPIIKPIFRPISGFLERIYQPWAKICALGLFVGTMIWVWFGMPKEYVNLGREKKSVWTDLRIWTIISMLPHIIVYLYF